MPILSRYVIQAPVATLAALKAISITNVSSGVAVYCIELQDFYVYSSSSTGTSDDFNVVTPNAGSGRWLRVNPSSAYVATGLSSNVDLTSTTNFPVCPTFISVSFTAGTFKIILPATTASNSAIKGRLIFIKNTGTLGQEFSIIAQDGSTIIVSTVNVGDYIILELASSATANGTWVFKILNSMAGQSAASVAITGGFITGITDLAIADGGTNASSFSTSTGIVKYDGTRLVSSTTAKIDASDRMTNTSQPAFSAYKSAQTDNVTGDGTVYTVICDTEITDQGGIYNNGTGVMTAPISGSYQLNAGIINVGGTTLNALSNARITTSNRTWVGYVSTAFAGRYPGYVSVLADMDAGDTAMVQDFINDTGGKIVDVYGDASGNTFFNGYLVC